MSEYIERGALLKEIRKQLGSIGEHVLILIAHLPTADVEPVVRGEWVKHADGGTDENGYWHETPYYVCSNCGRVVTSTTARCHGCFAHMKRSDPRAATNQVDRCMTCDNNGKPIC